MKGGGLDDLDVPDAGEEVGDGLDVPVGHLVLSFNLGFLHRTQKLFHPAVDCMASGEGLLLIVLEPLDPELLDHPGLPVGQHPPVLLAHRLPQNLADAGSCDAFSARKRYADNITLRENWRRLRRFAGFS